MICQFPLLYIVNFKIQNRSLPFGWVRPSEWWIGQSQREPKIWANQYKNSSDGFDSNTTLIFITIFYKKMYKKF